MVIAAAIVAVAFFMSSWHISCKRQEDTLTDISRLAVSYADKIASPDNCYDVMRDSILHASGDSARYNRLCRFSRSLFENGDQLFAFKYLKNCITILNDKSSLSPEESKYKTYCYLLLGAAADEVGLRTISQGFYFEGLKAIDEYGLSEFVGDFNNNIGVSLFKAGEYDRAREYFEKAIQQGECTGNKHLLYIVFNNMSELASEANDNDKALYLSLKAINYIDSKSCSPEYNSMLYTIGELYRRKGDYPMALTYMRSALNNQSKTENRIYLFNTCIGMADVFKSMDMPDSALRYIGMAESMVAGKNNPEQTRTLLEKKAELTSAKGDFRTAYQYEKEITNLKDSLYNEECHARMMEANTIYDIGRETERDRGGIEDWNPTAVFFSMGCIMLALFAALVWIVIMKRNNDSLNLQKRQAISLRNPDKHPLKANFNLFHLLICLYMV